MAEIAVSLVIDKLGPLLVQEVRMLRGVHKEIKDVEIELKSIRCFLKDAEAKAAAEEFQGKKSNEGVQLWVEQVREMAYCIEDVIDEFASTVAQLPHGKGLVGILQKINCSIKKLKLRRDIANNIQDIKSLLVKIDERRKRYGLNSLEEGSSSETKYNLQNGKNGVSSYYMEEDQIVGYESIRKELNDWMVDRIPGQKVIALLGAGGLGKTTLAASVYKNKKVKSDFHCHAWICVGKTYNKEDLLRGMIQKFYRSMEESAPRNIETMDELELIGMSRKYLENKSYMVVFDDVWKDEFWAEVEHALVDNNKSNRIIVTTRSKDVAHFIQASVGQVIKLEGLPSDKAWQLFCRKSFNSDGFCPAELAELSSKILEKCGGLPLAIVAIGCLLSKKKKTTTEWQKLLNNLGSELGSDPHLRSCNRVLSEGYNDLPHHLKPCLLYFGLFPKNYLIFNWRLIRLWMAEGFIKFPDKNCEPEEIGEAYLIELIQRSLVQVSRKDFKGSPKICRVHDLMYDIILEKAKQLGFSELSIECATSQSRKTRRLSIQRSTDNVLEKIKDSKVRSIIFSNLDELPESSICRLMFVANFKLMKVLDFEDAPIQDLPEGVGNFFHLNYLSLRKTKVKILPKTIGKLINLETLNLKETLVSELPVEIKHLKKLRYLRVTRCNYHTLSFVEGARIQEGFGSLVDIRKLTFVQLDSKALVELKRLRQLRMLGIQLVNGNDQRHLCSCIENMKYLIDLHIDLINKHDILDIEAMASPAKYLETLYLVGKLKKLPDWISNHQNLVRLYLGRSGFTEDPLRLLHTLPNLLLLCLVEAYNGEQMHIKQGWFRKLKHLSLYDFKGLKCIMIEDGAVHLLEDLLISECPLLKEIPSGIENLRNLHTLFFHKMLKEIELNSTFVTHETLEKLKHIPKVIASATGEGGEAIVMSVKDIMDLRLKSADSLPGK